MKTVNRFSFIMWVCTLAAFLMVAKSANALDKKIVAYFLEWGIYPPHGDYYVSDIPWDMVTHINYAFLAPTETGGINIHDDWATIQRPFGGDEDYPYKGNFGQFYKYKLDHPSTTVKILASIGGWSLSKTFPTIASTETLRETFANNCVNFLRTYSFFDGIDIDWEWVTAPDKDNFTFLLAKIREKLNAAGIADNKTYLLTIAAPSGLSNVACTNPGAYHQYLDYISIMSYDFNGPWGDPCAITNHHAPLYDNPDNPGDKKLNDNSAVIEYLKSVPAEKLNLGVPYYSRSWAGVTGGSNGLFASAAGPASDPLVWEAGVYPFYYLKESVESDPAYTMYLDDEAEAAYLWSSTKQIFHSYENETSLLKKLDYVYSKQLGGMMMWDLTGDYPKKGGTTLTSIIYNYFQSPPFCNTMLNFSDAGDYNGDGVSEIAIFRPSSGLWAIRGLGRTYFGKSGDIPASGDYDGDGITDIAIFRNSTGLWAVKDLTRIYFGNDYDLPVPSDYNGDGTCDFAHFCEDDGIWSVRNFTRVYYGTTGDSPIPGNYDGDENTDIAIFRPSSGLWAIRGISRVYFGATDDYPVPGVYRWYGNREYAGGPFRSEIGIYRSSSGLWAIRGLTRYYFGAASDTPVLGDFTGGSLDNIGIFRSTSGLWAIRGITRTYFGSTWDIPLTR